MGLEKESNSQSFPAVALRLDKTPLLQTSLDVGRNFIRRPFGFTESFFIFYFLVLPCKLRILFHCISQTIVDTLDHHDCITCLVSKWLIPCGFDRPNFQSCWRAEGFQGLLPFQPAVIELDSCKNFENTSIRANDRI